SARDGASAPPETFQSAEPCNLRRRLTARSRSSELNDSCMETNREDGGGCTGAVSGGGVRDVEPARGERSMIPYPNRCRTRNDESGSSRRPPSAVPAAKS